MTEDSVIKAIAKLRRVFHDDAREPRVIETLTKSGYRLIARVSPATEGEQRTTAGSDAKGRSALRQRGPALKWIAGAGVMALLLLGFWSVFDRNNQDHTSPPPVSERPSVAVIPFSNLGRAPDDDYFANGITADLITDLSKLKRLLVIAPQTTFAYRDSDAEPALVSSKLDVDYLVTGSVQRLEQTLRINVRLIEARTGQALWGSAMLGS